MARPKVWVTRARPGAERTAQTLAAMGFEPVVQPLLALDPDFRAPEIETAVEDASALAFTSPNGVEAFARLTDRRDRPVYAVGDRTAGAARAAGFAQVISADGNAGTLAERIARDAEVLGGPVLAPGAAEPAADLSALLAGRVAVVRLAVYDVVEVAQAAPTDLYAVLVHSARAAQALVRRLGPEESRAILAVALSPAVAEPLSARPFAAIRIAASPRDADLLAALGNPRDDV